MALNTMEVEADNERGKVSGSRERRAKEREGLELKKEVKRSNKRAQLQSDSAEPSKKSVRRGENGPSSDAVVQDDSVITEPMETESEEQPVLVEQLVVEEQPAYQGGEGGEEIEDMRKVIRCKQGTRQGEKCTDILWVGNVDDEGNFILRRNIKDYFFKYIPEGYQTIMVRTTVEVPISMIVEWVCEFFAKKLGKPEPWNCIGKELVLNFKGVSQPGGQHLVSTYPQNSLFLLSKGPLPEELKNHQGKLWQCTGMCGKAQDRRDNIFSDKKCEHKVLFDRDQPNGLGDHLKRDNHFPMLTCGTTKPATKVRKSS